MRTRGQERAEALRTAATGHGQREWEVGQLLASWLASHPDAVASAKGKLDNVVTRSRDIAALAMTCRAFGSLAKRTLWARLGAQFPSQPAGSAKWPAGFTVIPQPLGYVARQLSNPWPGPKLRNVDRLAAKTQLAWEYKHTVPQEVPCHIFTEVKSLRCLGMAASSTKKVFMLTDKDLQQLNGSTVNRGRLGTAHVYKLPDLLVAAREKHGSDAGMAAARAAVEDKAAQAKHNRQAARASRQQALADGLQKLGIPLTPDITGVGLVSGYIAGAKGATRDVQEVVDVVQLIDWCLRHTHYDSIRDNMSDGETRYMRFKVMFNNSYDKAIKAAETLSNQEEWDCINLAVQMWAKARGGAAAALARPSVPTRGRLRASIVKALAAHVDDGFRMDAGFWSDNDDDDWDEQGQEVGDSEDEQESEVEEEQGGSSDGEGEAESEQGSGEEDSDGE